MYKARVDKSELDELFDAILNLEGREECAAFFDDLCTVAEIKSLAQRWQVARMLYGNARYQDVKEETGASSTTISRVKKCLEYGEGYAKALDRRKQRNLTEQKE